MTEGHLTPVFNPNAEAHAMQSLNAVMTMFQTTHDPVGPENLVELHERLTRLVDCLFPIKGNGADLAGEAPLPAGHYVHPIKAAEAAVLLGRATGMPRSRLITLAHAAALMNIGYLRLKQSLIDEPRKLMEGEWEHEMHEHPAHSVTALTASGLPHDAIVAIGQHHERWDGSGYPHGVREDEICVEARILAIADSFVSLRSTRPHRAAKPTKEAVQVIAAGGGTLYEPSLADAFIQVIATYAEPEKRAKATTSSAPASAGDPIPAERGGWLEALREEYAPGTRGPQREPDDPHETRTRERTLQRTQRPASDMATASAASVVVAAPVPAATQRTSTPTPIRRQLVTPRSVGPSRRRRSLFSADVYVLGLRGASPR